MTSLYFESKEGFQLHCLNWEPNPERDANRQARSIPLVCIHGNLASAMTYRWIGDQVSSGQWGKPRSVYALDMRGCGESELPAHGFSVECFANDIRDLLAAFQIEQAHFVSFSRGVINTLCFAKHHPRVIQNLVIGDFPPYANPLSPQWSQNVLAHYKTYADWEELYQEARRAEGDLTRQEFEARKEDFYKLSAGRVVPRYQKELAPRIQAESRQVDVSDALAYINGKILVLKGERKGSLLQEEDLLAYEKHGAVQIERIAEAGHDVLYPRERTADLLKRFFETCD